jgi:hypothetical protein
MEIMGLSSRSWMTILVLNPMVTWGSPILRDLHIFILMTAGSQLCLLSCCLCTHFVLHNPYPKHVRTHQHLSRNLGDLLDAIISSFFGWAISTCSLIKSQLLLITSSLFCILWWIKTLFSQLQNLQDGAPKIAKLPSKWLNYGLW